MRKFPVAVLFAGLGILASFAFTHSATLQLFEARSWDVRQRFSAEHLSPDPRIKLVLIDQSSLDFVSKNFDISWPWPREYEAAIIDFLRRGGARGVAFDLIFSEPSPAGNADDKLLADATRTFGKVVHALVVRSKSEKIEELSQTFDWTKRLPPDVLSLFVQASYVGTGVLLPTETIAAAADAIASVTAFPDSDGIFRHTLLAGRIGNAIVPNLPAALALTAGEKIPTSTLAPTIDENRSLVIRFAKPNSYQSFSAAALINSELALRNHEQPQLDPAVFKGSLVFVGVSAPGLFDVKPTSIDTKLLGVEMNAHILDNLLHSRFGKSFTRGETMLISALFTFVVAASTFAATSTGLILFRQFCLLGLWSAAAFTAALYGLWVPLTVPFAAGTLVALISFAYVYSHEGKQRRFVTSAFKQYVSPEVIESIIAHPEKLSLTGETREVTVFFSDVEGFTSLSERLDPHVLSEALNLYLTTLTDTILEHGGTVDKYVGDAIIAIWNAPLDDLAHARRAVAAAISCQQRLRAISPQLLTMADSVFRTRIGIHTGRAMVGNFGSKQRFNYTAIGDTVNFAARLESLNKKFGTEILLSEQTYAKIGETAGENEILCRSLGEVKVVGKEQFVRIYNPCFEDEQRALFEEFERARTLMRQGDLKGSERSFKELSARDPVSGLYLKKLSEGIEQGIVDRWIFESK